MRQKKAGFCVYLFGHYGVGRQIEETDDMVKTRKELKTANSLKKESSLRPAGRPGPKRVGPKSTKNPRSITFHAAHRARGRDAGTLAPPRIPPRTTYRTLLHLNVTQQPSGWGQPLGRNAGANC